MGGRGRERGRATTANTNKGEFEYVELSQKTTDKLVSAEEGCVAQKQPKKSNVLDNVCFFSCRSVGGEEGKEEDGEGGGGEEGGEGEREGNVEKSGLKD